MKKTISILLSLLISVFFTTGALQFNEVQAYNLSAVQVEFVETVGTYAQQHYAESQILPSFVAAQALLESKSGSGLSGLATKYNNFWGMKAGSYTGKTIELKTTEYNSSGTPYTTYAKFRAYGSFEEGVLGYYEFINSLSRYHNIIGEKDYRTVCRLIREDGWATDPNYTTSLIKLIEEYNLTKFDASIKNVTDEPIAPYPRPSGSPLIQKGSKGDYVKWVQYTLSVKLGYSVGSAGVDGDFGSATDAAVRAFQRDNGLEVDGQVGPATIAKIVELLKKPDDTEAPVISNAQVFDIDATGYSIKCTVTDNVGVTKVQFPTWTENNGQDDLIWHDASVSGNTYSYRISVSDHNNEYGRYVTHIYAWDAAGNSTSAGGADFELKVGSKMDKGAGQTIPDGDYYIFSGLMDNYYLDIDGSEVPAESKTSVHMWTSSSDKLPPECDAWTVKHEGNGFYTISQKGAPICLDLYGANPTRGASICVHTANGSDAQLWSISSTGKGYSIQAKCSGYCLDVYGSEKNNGTAVLVWEATNNPNQEWMFVPLLEAPQTSIIKADKKSVLVGESITFSAESDTASDYTIIVKSGADEVLQQKMVNGKASLSFTDAADYTAYVTAYNEKGSIDSGTIKFNVTSNIIIQEGDSFHIPITDEKLTYKSHNTNVATVSKDGLITGKQKGTTVVSVVTKDNDVIQYTVNVVETFIEGDCNSDGNFDIADVVLLQKWLLTEVKTLDNWKAADFCQDNRLDVFDLCLMKRKLING